MAERTSTSAHSFTDYIGNVGPTYDQRRQKTANLSLCVKRERGERDRCHVNGEVFDGKRGARQLRRPIYIDQGAPWGMPGATCLSDIAGLRAQPSMFGPVPSAATVWRTFDQIGPDQHRQIVTTRAAARTRALAAGREFVGLGFTSPSRMRFGRSAPTNPDRSTPAGGDFGP